MIDEKRLLDILDAGREAVKTHSSGADETIEKTLDIVMDCIRSQETVGEWIPTEERLPENNDYILMSSPDDDYAYIGRYEKDECGGGAFYIDGALESCSHYNIFINAWMPLPKAYGYGEE